MSEYAKRDTEALGEHYTRHVWAMTQEGLHDKADIAAELAHRDAVIANLLAALETIAQRAKAVTDAGTNVKTIWHVRGLARAAIARATQAPGTEGES